MNKLLTGKLLNEQVYSGELSKIIARCTQIEPSNRYKNIDHLDKDLCRCIEHLPEKELSKREYLPPGFRSGNIVVMLLALIGYFFMLSITLTMTVKNITPREPWVTRITATVAFLGITFFTGNYLGCQAYLPLSRSKNTALRVLGILLWDAVIFCGCIIVGATFT